MNGDDHAPMRHLAGALWLALPERVRWWVVRKVGDRRPDLCWCSLVDAALLSPKADYRKPWGCACDVPLPTDARPPVPGECYCPPAETKEGA